MGVPAFYRWLAEKYPKTVVDCVEAEAPPLADGSSDFGALDWRAPSPNGTEVDNLYLDMNGVIHPCARPEVGPAPSSEEHIFQNIEKYIDRLLAAVRPRRLIYMAVDGPAPRAKMNQQRSRRFKAAKDAAERDAAEERLRAEWRARGLEPPPKRDAAAFAFDSNVITPGTQFMARLAAALRAYVARRLASHPAWRGLAVVLSDASVPGEGEHKIMEHIRAQRAMPGYDANMWHCVHGLDADLIMLALATHEPRFLILREVVFSAKDRKRQLRQDGRAGLGAADDDDETDEAAATAAALRRGGKPLQFLRIHTLREYLAVEFERMSFRGTAVTFELERLIDDFVFLCFFVGNDFLPHMPALEIHDGAIDTLMSLYRDGMGELGGFVTDRGEVDLARAELLLRKIGAYEEEVLSRRRRRDAGRLRMVGERERAVAAEVASAAAVAAGGASPYGSLFPPQTADALKLWKQLEAFADARAYDQTLKIEPNGGILRACAHLYCHMLGLRAEAGYGERALVVSAPLPTDAEAAAADAAAGAGAARAVAASAAAPAADGGNAAGGAAAARRAKGGGASGNAAQHGQSMAAPPSGADAAARASRFAVELKLLLDRRDEELQAARDDVRYGTPGWRERYYACKLQIGADEPARLREVVQAYVEGLIWVLRYYYKGVQSWGWFYPYHYAPCASDMKGLRELAPRIRFDKGAPWSPLTQLMAVFPARSGHAMPAPYRALMGARVSAVVDFFPSDFKQDLNGKKFGWQAIAVLPFIDAPRLHAALEPLRAQLGVEERARDEHGPARVYARADAPLGTELRALAGAVGEHSKHFVASAAVAFGGTALRPAELHGDAAASVVDCTLAPPPVAGHVSRLLPTVQLPARTLLDGEGPVLSRDAKNLAKERERGANGGGYGQGARGGFGAQAARRAGIGHADRPASASAAAAGSRMVYHALGARAVNAATGARAGAPTAQAGGVRLSNAYSVLSLE
ncbi:hypothetical protein KFE25_013176 [Diacronema lutheri]|uniref:5'-3' exoribonuclease n=1 Tax=Diacronema lutheri TaxID=2081491 RepID=A0A8J5X485_DIALT|nr:hypothetical protein KFE25_013176 [Diacronema lutheri]